MENFSIRHTLHTGKDKRVEPLHTQQSIGRWLFANTRHINPTYIFGHPQLHIFKATCTDTEHSPEGSHTNWILNIGNSVDKSQHSLCQTLPPPRGSGPASAALDLLW